jgi:phosphoribosylglycinamide formyltransferase 1
VLASGSGTNLQALIDSPQIRPRLALVVSDQPGAGALTRADAAGIPTAVALFEDHPDRASFSSALADLVEDSGAKVVVLAGFMRVLAPSFLDRFPGHVVNIHPSLLPAFAGARAVEAAMAHGVRVTGVTIHFVDDKVDHGPIIAQEAVVVEEGDTVDTLHARIKEVEHRLYPPLVAALVSGELRLEGSRVVWR